MLGDWRMLFFVVVSAPIVRFVYAQGEFFLPGAMLVHQGGKFVQRLVGLRCL